MHSLRAAAVTVKTPGDLVFPYAMKNIDGMTLVNDAEIPDAHLDMREDHKLVVENAGLITPVICSTQLGCNL